MSQIECLAPWFQGKTAVVTGGSRGIGSTISGLLARCGARVFINYKENEEAALSTLKQIEAGGGEAELARANLLYPEEIRSLFEQVARAGKLDILVHSAALGSFKPVVDLRANQWDLTMNTNARALLLCAQAAARLMNPGSSIVSISSLGSTRHVPAYGAIGVSKAALESLTRYLAVELAERGIRVNAVSGGVIDGGSLHLHPGYEGLVEAAIKRSPLKRLGSPEDLARVVLFLLSPLAGWITGQVIVADGGLSLAL